MQTLYEKSEHELAASRRLSKSAIQASTRLPRVGPDEPPVIVSYLRFSTRKQKDGDSERRQNAKLEGYRTSVGGVFAHQIEDLGRSAYRGRNSVEGNLGRFIDLVEQGRVRPGTRLVVEALDRLSRDKVESALQLFLTIIKAGVDIVTLGDSGTRHYQAGKISAFDLIISIMELSTANGESARKGELSGANWDEKREQLDDGVILTKRGPGWLRLTDDRQRWEEIPEMTAIVRRVFAWIEQGYGGEWIAKRLNQEDAPRLWKGKRWHCTQVLKLARNRAVIGHFQPHKHVHDEDGLMTREPVGQLRTDYYPVIIEPAQFLRVQDILDGRRLNTAAVHRKGLVSNLFLGIARCGAPASAERRAAGHEATCNGHMIFRDRGNRGVSRGWLICSEKRGGKCDAKGIRCEAFEEAFLDVVTQVEIPDPKNASDKVADIEMLIGRRQVERDDVQRRVEALLDQMETGGKDPTIRARYGQRTEQLAALDTTLADLRADLVRAQGAGQTNADRQRQLAESRGLTGESSTQARLGMHRNISEIVDKILVEPTGEVTVIMGHGALNYLFAADMKSVRCTSLLRQVAAGMIDEKVFASGPDGKVDGRAQSRLRRFIQQN